MTEDVATGLFNAALDEFNCDLKNPSDGVIDKLIDTKTDSWNQSDKDKLAKARKTFPVVWHDLYTAACKEVVAKKRFCVDDIRTHSGVVPLLTTADMDPKATERATKKLADMVEENTAHKKDLVTKDITIEGLKTEISLLKASIMTANTKHMELCNYTGSVLKGIENYNTSVTGSLVELRHMYDCLKQVTLTHAATQFPTPAATEGASTSAQGGAAGGASRS